MIFQDIPLDTEISLSHITNLPNMGQVVAGLVTGVSGLASDINGLNSDVSAISASVTSLDTSIGVVSSSIASMGSSITAIGADVTALNNRIQVSGSDIYITLTPSKRVKIDSDNNIIVQIGY